MPDLTYQDFLHSKIQVAPRMGLELTGAPNPHLKEHQQIAVRWALGLGRALIAARFGLGKTRIQIELARQIHLQTGGRFLQICPLGVKHQFQYEDGPAMGVEYAYVRNDQEILDAATPYLITNYERVREGNINLRLLASLGEAPLAGVSLDEGSILRDMGSDTYQVFADVCADIAFRFVNTATPSPNRYIELLNYAEFLGVMDRGQALTRWFKRDPNKAGNLTLHPHHEREFWLWVASWALFIYKPSDLCGCECHKHSGASSAR